MTTSRVAVGWIVVFGFAGNVGPHITGSYQSSLDGAEVRADCSLFFVELLGSAFYLFDLEFRLPKAAVSAELRSRRTSTCFQDDPYLERTLYWATSTLHNLQQRAYCI